MRLPVAVLFEPVHGLLSPQPRRLTLLSRQSFAIPSDNTLMIFYHILDSIFGLVC